VVYGILGFDPYNRDEIATEHEDEEGITSFETLVTFEDAVRPSGCIVRYR